MKSLRDKNILLFSPVFFGYETKIKEELEKKSKCVYYDERARASTFEKICIRVNFRILIAHKIARYYHRIINKYEENHFDYVIFFSPETVTTTILSELKKRHPNARFILYMWDSFEHRPHPRCLVPLFDRCYTFCKEDSVKYGISFLPLFYTDDYDADFISGKSKCDIDIGFIGTIHSDRYWILKAIKLWADKLHLRTFFYMYFPSRIVYWKYKIENLRRGHLDKKDFRFKPLPSADVRDILNRCRVVVDTQRSNQSGLTIRTIEMLGLRKKLITTNDRVKMYDFYNPRNVQIIDRERVQINSSFFDQDFDDSIDAFRERYSIKHFTNVLLDGDF